MVYYPSNRLLHENLQKFLKSHHHVENKRKRPTLFCSRLIWLQHTLFPLSSIATPSLSLSLPFFSMCSRYSLPNQAQRSKVKATAKDFPFRDHFWPQCCAGLSTWSSVAKFEVPDWGDIVDSWKGCQLVVVSRQPGGPVRLWIARRKTLKRILFQLRPRIWPHTNFLHTVSLKMMKERTYQKSE